MSYRLNLIAKVTPHRDDVGGIVKFLFGDKLDDYKPSKTYKPGDIIYHYEPLEKTFKFLTCIKETTGPFKEGDWKYDPDALSSTLGGNGGLTKLDDPPGYPPYNKEARTEVAIEAVSRIMGDARREGIMGVYTPEPAMTFPIVLDKAVSKTLTLPKATFSNIEETNEVLMYIDVDYIKNGDQSEDWNGMSNKDNVYEYEVELVVKNGGSKVTKMFKTNFNTAFIGIDDVVNDAEYLKPDTVFENAYVKNIKVTPKGSDTQGTKFAVIHNIIIAYCKKY